MHDLYAGEISSFDRWPFELQSLLMSIPRVMNVMFAQRSEYILNVAATLQSTLGLTLEDIDQLYYILQVDSGHVAGEKLACRTEISA